MMCMEPRLDTRSQKDPQALQTAPIVPRRAAGVWAQVTLPGDHTTRWRCPPSTLGPRTPRDASQCWKVESVG